MYTLVQSPDEILRTPTNLTSLPLEKLTKIVAEMKQILLSQSDPEGVGLAANQIGLPYSFFIARFTVKKNEPIHVFINPQIVSHSDELQPDKKEKPPLEGCLSLPKYYGIVKRWKWIELRYQKITDYGLQTTADSSQWTVDRFEGFPAVVIQHEIDHLNGKIFVERILEQQGKIYKVAGKNNRGKDMWEEVEL